MIQSIKDTSAYTCNDIEEERLDLPFLSRHVYLNNAAVSPISLSVQAAANRYNDLTVHRCQEAWAISEQEFDRGRSYAATLVNSDAANIAYVQNTSQGLSFVAMGLDWNEGDNVVVPEDEFPSNYLCWLQLERIGVQVRKVPARGGQIEPSDVAPFVDSRTRLVTISHVQFYSGYRIDLRGISEICRANDCLLVVDGTQSIGALCIDLQGDGVDVLVVSGHKWLMAPHGIGFMAFSDRALHRIQPRVLGWLSVERPFEFRRAIELLPSAKRFEAGTPNGAGIFGLTERLKRILSLGPDRLEQRVLSLNRYLRETCLSNSLRLVYAFEEVNHSGIALIQVPGVDPQTLLAALEQAGICASVRSQAIRFSPHYFNTKGEIDRAVHALLAAG